jgi:hypothetical protein
MSYLSTRFFNTLLHTVPSKKDRQALREHVNQVNAKYFGNGLNPGKLHAYFADLMGASNANKLTEQLTTNTLPIVTPLDTFNYVIKATRTLEQYMLFSPNLTQDTRHPSVLMVFPITEFTTTGIEDSPENNRFFLALSVTVSVSMSTGKLDVMAEQIIWDTTDETNTDISYGWDMRNGLEDYLCDDNEMGYGALLTRHPRPSAIGLLGYQVSWDKQSHEQDFFSAASFALMKELVQALSRVGELTSLPAQSDAHEVFRLVTA